MDVTALEEELRVIEVNGFNSAGFYESDVQAIVAAISGWVKEAGPGLTGSKS